MGCCDCLAGCNDKSVLAFAPALRGVIPYTDERQNNHWPLSADFVEEVCGECGVLDHHEMSCGTGPLSRRAGFWHRDQHLFDIGWNDRPQSCAVLVLTPVSSMKTRLSSKSHPI